jgi:hypothetical protein
MWKYSDYKSNNAPCNEIRIYSNNITGWKSPNPKSEMFQNLKLFECWHKKVLDFETLWISDFWVRMFSQIFKYASIPKSKNKNSKIWIYFWSYTFQIGTFNLKSPLIISLIDNTYSTFLDTFISGHPIIMLLNIFFNCKWDYFKPTLL